MTPSYLAVEIADDKLLTAIAEEDALIDATLDQLERDVVSPRTDAGRAAALALTIGRAGRPRSAAPLRAAIARLESAGQMLQAQAVALALELLPLRPEIVERAERGYRRQDPITGAELFVEDPLAAHWHHEGRWGPPLRPDPDRKLVLARGDPPIDRLVSAVREGEIVLVTFQPDGVFRRPEPPLRLMRAGLSRTPSLDALTRWSEIVSVGAVERRWPDRRRRAAYEPKGGPELALPPHPSITTDSLIALMTRLLKAGRAC